MVDLKKTKLNCLDVGSRGGLPEHWKKFSNNLKIDAFDPDIKAEHGEYKYHNGVNWYSYGLARKTEKLDFYITSRPSGSSVFKPHYENMSKYSPKAYWTVKEKRNLEFLSLSDFLTKYKKKSPDLIKLDTQGSELDIIKSLKKNQIDEVLAIEIEVEFIEMYKNQPLFKDIDDFLKKNNFEIMDLRTHRSYRIKDEDRGGFSKKFYNVVNLPNDFSAKLIAGDAIYLKKIDKSILRDKNKLLKILKILVIYHFFDETLAILDDAFKNNFINKKEKNLISNDIRFFSPKISFIYKKNNLIRKFISILKRVLAKYLQKNKIKNKKITAWTFRQWPDQ